MCAPSANPHPSFSFFSSFNPTTYHVFPKREPPTFLLFSCSRASNTTLSLCAPSAIPDSFFCLALALQPNPFLCVSPAQTPRLSSFLLFSRFNPTTFVVCRLRECQSFILFSSSQAPTLPVSLCARSANPYFFVFSLVSVLQPQPLFDFVPPSPDRNLSSFLLFGCFESNQFCVCPQRETPPFLLFACSRASTSPLPLCAPSVNHHHSLSFVVELQPTPVLSVPPARNPTISSFLSFSRFKPIPLFVCPQRKPQSFFLFSCSRASTPTFSFGASALNPTLSSFVLFSRFNPANFCVPPAQTPIFYFFLLFSRFKPITFFVCTQRQAPRFRLFSCSRASTPPLSFCAPSARPHPIFFSLVTKSCSGSCKYWFVTSRNS